MDTARRLTDPHTKRENVEGAETDEERAPSPEASDESFDPRGFDDPVELVDNGDSHEAPLI